MSLRAATLLLTLVFFFTALVDLCAAAEGGDCPEIASICKPKPGTCECDCPVQKYSECDPDPVTCACYKPLKCSKATECACKGTNSVSSCGKCVSDSGSVFKDDNVCVCTKGGSTEVGSAPRRAIRGPLLNVKLASSLLALERMSNAKPTKPNLC